MSDKLRIDPIACTGHGLCAELFPERIWLDDWGYPVIEDGDLSPELLQHARRAVDACPTLALRLERERRAARAGSALRPAGRKAR
ncbi:MAG TPA: ferredoxin [Solirubrobacteraceae bacterium]|jgi:ferredoxin|nr:ferredoxin [Solirubrobacteraceae bacterium]